MKLVYWFLLSFLGMIFKGSDFHAEGLVKLPQEDAHRLIGVRSGNGCLDHSIDCRNKA